MPLNLPYPGQPAANSSLASAPVQQNIAAIAQAIQSFDGSQIQSGTVAASALNANINPNTFLNDTIHPFVQSGCVWSPVTGLVGTMSSGVVYVGPSGLINRAPINGVGSHTFTASQDTYIDIDYNGNINYQGVSNGASAPSLTANSVRVAKVVTGASTISTITQAGTDSNGVEIYSVLPYLTGAPVSMTTAGTSTTTGTSYGNLADSITTSVTTTIGKSGIALVVVTCELFNNSGNDFSYAAFSMSGSNTASAADSLSIANKNSAGISDILVSACFLKTGLSPGATTFTLAYRVSASTGGFLNRSIAVIPF